MNNRITPETQIHDGLMLMCGGNPGALTVCLELMGGKGASEDQQAEGYMDICRMDDQHVYESDIWVVYKDICKFDLNKMRDLIRDYKLQEELKKL